ncbi:MAG: NDP-sugar synthase [Pirellulaceae bacterium]
MQAFILAGGLGTRLRSLVNDRPKPLAPIGSAPFLEHQLRFLKAQRISEFVFCVGYRHEQIQDHFGDGQRWGVSIIYSVEDRPLGTAGALKHAERYANGAFLVLNGDTFVDLDVNALIQAHHSGHIGHSACLATVALTETDDPRGYGSIRLGEEDAIVAFREKEAVETDVRYVNAGVYVLEPRIFTLIPVSQNISLERDTFPRVLDSDYKIRGFRTGGFFVDIGTPEGYHRFREHIGDLTS